MTRARVCGLLLSALLWHMAVPCLVAFLPVSRASGATIEAAQDEGQSAWVPSASGTTELVNAIRGNRVRPCAAQRPVALFDEVRPQLSPWRLPSPHRSIYPARHELRLRLGRSESGELPH
jgi:hypothetical protein